MKDYKFDYNKSDNSHFSMPSMYGKIVRQQYNAQPKLPGSSHCADGQMKGAKRNTQKGV